jgi:two-component system, cell cycle sensor histidine kinase and response regulator CckA
VDREIRVLILEDNPADAELLERELRKAGFAFVASRVDTREAYERELDEGKPDIVFSDYAMPSFDGMTALRLLRDRTQETPFLFVSGFIGEERAIEALRDGATDYVLKDRMGRLAPAVRRALRETAREAERRALEAQLLHAQKMEAVGRLAGGVAHDFNNLLTAILGYADLVLEATPESDARRPDVEEILRAGERAQELTRQLLAFSRKQVSRAECVDLNDVVARMSQLLRRLIGEDVRLTLKLSHDLVLVKIDPARAEQIVMNLAVNARDAMESGGELTLATESVRIGVDHVRVHRDATEGPHVLLTVSDTGAGMTEEVRNRLFEPFFTTKKQGKGTGLGLSTVYGIVKQAGGSIAVESAPGRGSTFKVYLPTATPEAPAESRREPIEAGARESAPILVVDDDEVVRRYVARILSNEGYVVRAAGDFDEAALIALDEEPRLLLTDVVLPGGGGRELAEALRTTYPNLRVLYMSGYADDERMTRGVVGPEVDFIEKPMTSAALREKVRAALRGDAAEDGPAPGVDAP